MASLTAAICERIEERFFAKRPVDEQVQPIRSPALDLGLTDALSTRGLGAC